MRRGKHHESVADASIKSPLRLRPAFCKTNVRPFSKISFAKNARTVLASFWARKFGLGEEELHDELALPAAPAPAAAESSEATDRVARILAALPANYRRVLELRFLRGYSLKEVAAETGNTVGGIKVMQLRALRAAAKVETNA